MWTINSARAISAYGEGQTDLCLGQKRKRPTKEARGRLTASPSEPQWARGFRIADCPSGMAAALKALCALRYGRNCDQLTDDARTAEWVDIFVCDAMGDRRLRTRNQNATRPRSTGCDRDR